MIPPSDGQPVDRSRRRWLTAAGQASVATAFASVAAWPAAAIGAPTSAATAAGFDVDGIYLNSASTHPWPRVTQQAMQAYFDRRAGNGRNASPRLIGEGDPKALLARLINAQPADIALIPSTSFGENAIISALGLAGSNARVVTDALHFMGGLYSYGELAKQGLDLEVLRPVDNRIPLSAWEKAITPGTRLVALSAVSMTTGLAQDLKAICRIAHARGALVYVDAVQAIGAVPFDVTDSGVDFCAASTYKWLMGDFGSGFLYVRPGRLAQLQRTQLGYRQLAKFSTHVFPYDPPAEPAFLAAPRDDVAGYFEIGTLANAAQAALIPSLNWLLEQGVANLHARRMPLLERLQDAAPSLGLAPLTPRGNQGPIVAFAAKDFAARYGKRLKQAGINVALYPHRLRVSPSAFNTMDDIEQLIEVLKG